MLQQLAKHIKASTTSMTSVPKPLKFMRPHYGTMTAIYTKLTNDEVKKACADIISVLAMTMGEKRECLKYRLASDINNIGEWGHEYVRYVFNFFVVINKLLICLYISDIWLVKLRRNGLN